VACQLELLLLRYRTWTQVIHLTQRRVAPRLLPILAPHPTLL
jgi:hypothetical protein